MTHATTLISVVKFTRVWPVLEVGDGEDMLPNIDIKGKAGRKSDDDCHQFVSKFEIVVLVKKLALNLNRFRSSWSSDLSVLSVSIIFNVYYFS